MDVKQLARSLGITQQPTVSRATELLRLLKLKVPGSLGQSEICRPGICLEIACQITPGSKLPLREEFIRYSCSAPKVYNEAFTRIQRLLDFSPALDLRELVTLFGCSQLHDSTQQLLNVYRSRYLESLTVTERARADLSRPVLVAAAFLLTTKKHRIQVDRAALIQKMGITRAELAAALEDFSTRCTDQLASAATHKQGRRASADDVREQSALGPSAAAEGRKGGPRSGVKRQRRTVVQCADDDEDGSEDRAAPAVAVDDFKLALIGVGPSATSKAAESPGERREGSRRARSRRKVASVRIAKELGAEEPEDEDLIPAADQQ